jgi:hypothetical protein
VGFGIFKFSFAATKRGVKMKFEQQIKEVCKVWDISFEDFISKTRRYPVPTARASVFRALRYDPFNFTLKQIGAMFGKNHSTVVSALQRLEDLAFTEPEIKKKMIQVQDIFGTTDVIDDDFIKKYGLRKRGDYSITSLQMLNVKLVIKKNGYVYIAHHSHLSPLGKFSKFKIGKIIRVLRGDL